MKLVILVLERVLTLLGWAAWLLLGFWLLLPVLPPAGNIAVGFLGGVSLQFGETWEVPGGTWKVRAAEVAVELVDRSPWEWQAYAVGWPMVLLLLLGARSLRDVVRSVELGTPFTQENARRIRNLGIAFLLWEGNRILWTYLLIAPALAQRPVKVGQLPMRVDHGPDVLMLFVGCIVLVLAQVFRRGAEMQDEQRLTV